MRFWTLCPNSLYSQSWERVEAIEPGEGEHTHSGMISLTKESVIWPLIPPSHFSLWPHTSVGPPGLSMVLCLLIFPTSCLSISHIFFLLPASPNPSAVSLHPLCLCTCWPICLHHHSLLPTSGKFMFHTQVKCSGQYEHFENSGDKVGMTVFSCGTEVRLWKPDSGPW